MTKRRETNAFSNHFCHSRFFSLPVLPPCLLLVSYGQIFSFFQCDKIGAAHLRDSDSLTTILEKQKQQGKLYAAICAAPAVVLASKEGGFIQEGATCYPAPQFREKLTNPTDDAVAVTGNLTTSMGPGTALLFALSLGEQLFGKEARDKIQNEMLV